MSTLLLIASALITISQSVDCSPKNPCIPLYNGAVEGTMMPLLGIGTGSYGKNSAMNKSNTPEQWNYTTAFDVTVMAFKAGYIRWDTAIDYVAVNGTADGVRNVTNEWTTTQREQLFITTKTGPGTPMGYNDTLNEFQYLTELWNTSYFDLILIHWPYQNVSTSSDPVCNASSGQYNAKLCRQETWKAYEYIFTTLKGAKAIGVSNFEKSDLEDIIELGGLIPAVNQLEFHGYWHEYDLLDFCASMNITVNSYAPLGTPDVSRDAWEPPTPILTQHPVAIDKGKKFNKSPSQIWIRWILQQGLVTNPRSWNMTHMKENLEVFDFELPQEDMLDLASIAVPADPKICHYPNQ